MNTNESAPEGAAAERETLKIVSLPLYRKAINTDFPLRLRELADCAARGEIDSAVVAYVGPDGAFNFLWPSSLTDSLVLAAMLQGLALDRMRVTPKFSET